MIPGSVSAQSVSLDSEVRSLLYPELVKPEPVVKPEIAVLPKPVVPVPIIYTVVSGDNLTKIGEAHNVEWQRLWAKNTQLISPDVLNVGEQLTIPFPDEVLIREIPFTNLPTSTPGVAPLASYSGGNTYSYGYCTWYVKNRRGASIPNSLGNAGEWYWRASSIGMAVGFTPRPGAIGVTTAGWWGHVVYVESVNANGSINISEMNAPYWGVISYRTANANEFSYIY